MLEGYEELLKEAFHSEKIRSAVRPYRGEHYRNGHLPTEKLYIEVVDEGVCNLIIGGTYFAFLAGRNIGDTKQS